MKLLVKDRNMLINYRDRLYAMCHHPDCDAPMVCPWAHKACRKRLGLDTAVLWEVAKALAQITAFSAYNRPIPKSELSMLCYAVRFVVNVFLLHDAEYKDELSVISELYTEVHILMIHHNCHDCF